MNNYHQPRTTENKVIFQTENCFSQTSSERIIIVEDLDSEIEDVSDDANPETTDDDRSTPSPRELEIDFPDSSSNDWRETKYADVIDDECDVTKSESHEIVISEMCESELFNDQSITIDLEAAISQSRSSPSPPAIQKETIQPNDNSVKAQTSPVQNIDSVESRSSSPTQNDDSVKERVSPPPSSPNKNANAIKPQFSPPIQNVKTRISAPEEKLHRRRSSDSISLSSSTLPPINRRRSSQERIKESRSVFT